MKPSLRCFPFLAALVILFALSACGDGQDAQSLEPLLRTIDGADGITSFHMNVSSENTGASWAVDYEAPNTFRIEQTNPATNGAICYAALPDGSASPDGSACRWELVSLEGLMYMRECSQSCSDWLQAYATLLAAQFGAFPSTTLPSFPLELLKSLQSPTIDSPDAQTEVISSDFDDAEVLFASERSSLGASSAGGVCDILIPLPLPGLGPTSTGSLCDELNPDNGGFAVIAVAAQDFTLLRIEATVTDEFGDEDVFTIVFDDIDNTEVDLSDIPGSQD